MALFFAITTAAVGFVYLYVVPQLSSSLTAEQLERLEMRGAEQAAHLEAQVGRPQRELDELVREVAAETDARVTLLAARAGRPAFVLADSDSDSDALALRYPPASGAVLTRSIRSGIETVGGREVGETAVPLLVDGEPVWVAVLSTPLDDVADNVALIRRQILIAGGIALTAALLAAWFAASAHARRLRRLEAAAVQVAEGNFSVPIPVDSTDEVGQLASSFDEMQSKLARLDSARREFIANASHELRTPIASLGGFIELLADDEPDAEARREFVATMREQVRRLEKLTADLLDLSRLDADAIQLSAGPTDLIAVASEVAREFGPAAEATGATIEVGGASGGAPLAHADRGRTVQILRILIDNAIKHTAPGTSIVITARADRGRCQIAVTDDGPGIPTDARDRIFERFYTAHSPGGSGLGLAIARELARLMSGDISLETRRGRTTLTLTLPLARELGAAQR